MILYNNLQFFNKYGKNLNLEKEHYIEVTANRNDDGASSALGYKDAVIEAITNIEGQIEFFNVIDPGEGYDEYTTIEIVDNSTEMTYTIDIPEFIELYDDETLGKYGMIASVTMPQKATGFSYPSYTYRGTMYLDKVSTGLIGSDRVFIIEDMQLGEDGDYTHSAPRSYTDLNGNGTYSIGAELIGDEYAQEDNAIHLFRVNKTDDIYPFVEIVESYDSMYVGIDSGENDSFSTYTSKRIIDTKDETAIAFDVMLKSENEGVFEQRLSIFESFEEDGEEWHYPLAIIDLYGETEGEDERLRLELDNFAIHVGAEEEKIFRDSDVNEELPDYILLNQKRKEMLLEYHNIFPYLGSYKGLVNMINFFGYDDLRLKEYWLNTKASVAKSTNKKVTRDGYPIDLSRLHAYASAYKNNNKIKKTLEVELSGKTNKEETEPDYKLPLFTDSDSDMTYDNAENGKAKIVNGAVVGREMNTNKSAYDDPEFKVDIQNLDSGKAARVIEKEVIVNTLDSLEKDEFIYKHVDVPMQLSQKGHDEKIESYMPSDTLVKTSKFGLFYDIIKETGEVDEYGIPYTEEAFSFSEDEILIKLFSLRNYLKERFMPANARLVDIVGEAVFYTRFSANTWKDSVAVYSVDRVYSFDYETESKYLIEDLHAYKDSGNTLDTDTAIREYYGYHPHNFTNDTLEFRNEEGKIGCPMTLTLQDLGLSWDDVDLTYDSLDDYSWHSLGRRDFSDISWNIEYCPGPGDSRTFAITDTGPVGSYTKTYKYTSYEGLVKDLLSSDSLAYKENENLVLADDIYLYDFYIAEVSDSYEEYSQDGDFDDDVFIEDVNDTGYLQIGFYVIAINDGDEIMTDAHNVFETVLPYSGKYKSQCLLYDSTNTPLSVIKEFEVNMPLPNFAVFGRSFTKPLSNWNLSECSWDDAAPQWRDSAKSNDLTWDDLYCVNWDTIDFSHYVDQSNPFISDMKGDLISVSEEDRYVGEITSVSDNTLILDGCYNLPGLEKGDIVYFRLGNIIEKAKVVSVTYDTDDSTTTLVVDDDKGINAKWEVLREIGGTVKIKGDLSKSLKYSINEGKYLLFRSTRIDDIKQYNIPVVSPLTSSDVIRGIVLSKEVDIKQGEFGRLYERKTLELTSDNYDPEAKTITPGQDIEDSELIDGYTTIFVETTLEDGTKYKQRLLLRETFIDDNGNTSLSLIELDGDMGMIARGTYSVAYWDYHVMTVKISVKATEGKSTKVELNLNDYPLNEAFKEDAEDWGDSALWYFDYIVKDGSFSIEVLSTEVEDGNTVVTLNDEYHELHQASRRFKVSWSSFDEEYAEIRYGTGIFSWDNLFDATWDDGEHLSWAMTEYFVAPRCGFKIEAIASGGTIQFNSSTREAPVEGMNPDRSMMTDDDEIYGRFSFKKVKGPDDWETACDELNSTRNAGLSRFYYMLDDDENPTKIVATAKGEGPEYLGYLLFGNGASGDITDDSGVSHTYPLGDYEGWNNLYEYGLNNKEAFWNPISRAYYENGKKEVSVGKDGRIEEEIRGWYPAARIDEGIAPKLVTRKYIDSESGNTVSDKYYEDLSREYSPLDWIEEPVNLKEMSCLDGSDTKDADYEAHASRGSNFDSSLKDSVRWRVDENMRLLYDYALNSPFSWDDFICSGKEIEVPSFTTLFFAPSNSIVAGKRNYVWTLYKFNGTEDECIVKGKDNLIWTFTKPGNYDLAIEMTDMNGNITKTTKYGVVKVN